MTTYESILTLANDESRENASRAARILRIILEGSDPGQTNADLEITMQDALTDFRHACDLLGWEFQTLDKAAHEHYRAEIAAHGVATA